MKARIIYLATFVMAMFAIVACSSENEFSDIMNDNNLLTENVEIFEIEEENSNVECPDKETYRGSVYHCFENKDELSGLYKIDDSKLLNWNNRTLVMVDVFYHALLYSFTKKVYKKGEKYVIELFENEGSAFREQCIDHRCFGILLDKANVKPEDIKLRTRMGIYESAKTDS